MNLRNAASDAPFTPYPNISTSHLNYSGKKSERLTFVFSNSDNTAFFDCNSKQAFFAMQEHKKNDEVKTNINEICRMQDGIGTIDNFKSVIHWHKYFFKTLSKRY